MKHHAAFLQRETGADPPASTELALIRIVRAGPDSQQSDLRLDRHGPVAASGPRRSVSAYLLEPDARVARIAGDGRVKAK
jgi:hypothetical protein